MRSEDAVLEAAAAIADFLGRVNVADLSDEQAALCAALRAALDALTWVAGLADGDGFGGAVENLQARSRTARSRRETFRNN